MYVRSLLAIAIAAQPFMASNVAAQASGAPRSDSGATQNNVAEQFRCGHALLADALAAHGGETRIAGVTQIEFALSGDSSNAYQGYLAARVDDPERDGAFTLKAAFDLASGRYWQTNEQRLRGGLVLSFDTTASGNTVVNMRNSPRTFTTSQTPAADAAAAQVYDFPARFMPPLLLRRARDNLTSVRCESGDKGERVLAFNWDARTRYRLIVAADRSVSELRVLQPDVLEGETEVVLRFNGRQQLGGLLFPQQVVLERRLAPQFTLALSDVVVNQAIAPERFAAPKEAIEIKEPAGIWSEKIAEGLWEVRGLGGGLYRTAVVEAADSLVVFDAPLAPAVTRQVAAHVREKISTKPVKYVVLSHFHTDHSAGLPTYADAGATILVTPSDEPFVRRMLGKRSRMFAPVTGAPAPAAVNIQVVDRRFAIPLDSGAALDVIRLRGSPHVTDILLAIHRPSGTALEADLFSGLTPFNETYAHFADWLERREPRVKLVVGVHHEPITAASLKEQARAYRRAGTPR